ncbi:MAG: hypothetical protein ACKVQW_14555 [Pyrinomonadaceae bacterium]
MNAAVTEFIKHHYRHFNATALIDATEGYKKHLNTGGKMMITLVGAIPTSKVSSQTSSTAASRHTKSRSPVK